MQKNTTQHHTAGSLRSPAPKTPKLRFPGFDSVWEEKKIVQVLKIGSGKDYKHLKEGSVPVFGTGGYMLSVDKPLYSGESVMIGRKGTIDKPFYYNGDFWTVDTLFYTYDFNGILPKFTDTIFKRINWQKYNEASGVPSLSKTTIEKIKINLPLLPEQQKIASFLGEVDTWIENLREQKKSLESYKKSLMQKIFSQQIRFKDEKGNEFPEWKVYGLGSLLKEVNEKAKDETNLKVLSSTIKGLFLQEDYFNKMIASSDVSGYKILRKNQLVFSPQNLWLGNINISKKYDVGIVSPSYRIFNIDKNIVLVDYIEAIIKSKRMLYEYELSSEQGASVVRRNLNMEIFNEIPLTLPSLLEQQKIAEFLSSVDTLLESKQQQITKAEEWKKGLMQGLFV